MFKMIIQDLRVSPGRAFLTGFSMLIGILAMIASVLAGTVGKQYLASTNEQLFGRAPTYSMPLSSPHFSEASALSDLIGTMSKDDLAATLTFTPQDDYTYIANRSVDDPPSASELANGLNVEAIYTTAGYASVYNLPLVAGRWITPADQLPRLELVANKPASGEFPLHSYAFLLANNTVTPTPLEVTGIVNDGLSYPRVYVNAEGLSAFAPQAWNSTNATFYWHDVTPRTNEQRTALIADLLHDYAPGSTNGLTRADSQDYEGVLRIISASFIVTSVLLLMVAAIGLINIGLASIEQRSHELLIRRALGATRASVASLVMGSSLVLAVLVAAIAVLISVALVESIPFFLPSDAPIPAPTYPYLAAVVAVAAAVATSLIGSLAPAIRATRLQPALALR